jgi:hypothetical protein
MVGMLLKYILAKWGVKVCFVFVIDLAQCGVQRLALLNFGDNF